MNAAITALWWAWQWWCCKGAGVARAAGDHSGHRPRRSADLNVTSFPPGGVAVNPEGAALKAPRPTARTEFFPLLKLIKTTFSKWSTGSAEPALSGVGREGLQQEPIRPGHRLQTFLLASAIRGTTRIDEAADHLHAELIEIDENLCRSELTPAQRAAAIKRRKQIWEAMHPIQVAQVGSPESGVGYKRPPKQTKEFAADTAEASGESKSQINRHVARATAVEEAGSSIADLAGTSLDKGTELDAFPASGLHG